MCDKDYTGGYKDEKACSYWDSGFVGPIFIYESKLKKDIVFLYSNVTASQTMSDTKSPWIAVKRKDENGSQITCAWCSCMTVAYETCNHVIACLYKIDYENSKELCSPACTEQACTCNKGTKMEIVLKRITDLTVRKKLASRDDKGSALLKVSREETRMKGLNSFDSRIESQRQINYDNISHFLEKFN